jgi:hypothetical protein
LSSLSIEKSNLELRGDNSYTHRIKEEPVDYEFIEFEAVKPREIVAESTVHLDTHSSTSSILLIKLSPLISKLDFSTVLDTRFL